MTNPQDPSDPVAAVLGLVLVAAGGAASLHQRLPARLLEAAAEHLGLPRRVANLETEVAEIKGKTQGTHDLVEEIHRATVPQKPKEGTS